MAVVDSSQRAAAADMLTKLYAGEGRTTPRNQIRTNASDSDEAGPELSKDRVVPDNFASAQNHLGRPTNAVLKRRPKQRLLTREKRSNMTL